MSLELATSVVFPRLILLMAASLANLDASSQLPLKVAMGPATSSLFDSPAAQTDSNAEKIGVERGAPSRLLRYARPRKPPTRGFGPRRARDAMFTARPLDPSMEIPRPPPAARLPTPSVPYVAPTPVGPHRPIKIYTRPLWMRLGY